MIVLWAAAMYLALKKQVHWIATIPAVFMTGVSITYILMAPEGFGIATSIAYPIGIIAALAALVIFFIALKKKSQNSTVDNQIYDAF